MKSIEIFSSNIPDSVFTIAIPTFCRSALLNEALLSALNQITDLTYDILVIDNNPERYDETEMTMLQYCKHPLVSYYKNKSNLGMAGNWNQLFLLSKGTWVCMLHDDDLLFPNYIDVLYNRIQNLHEPHIIFPTYRVSQSRKLDINTQSNNDMKAINVKLKSFISGNIIGPPVGMLVRKDFFRISTKFDSSSYPSIDWDFYIEASKIGNLYKIPEELCLYYIGENESLKKETIIGFYKNTRTISKKLSEYLAFPYNIINSLCYRNLVMFTIKWTSTISNKQVILEALKDIEFKPNRLLDMISSYFYKIISRFL